MHLARVGNEVDVVERDDRAEMLADAARLEKRGRAAIGRRALQSAGLFGSRGADHRRRRPARTYFGFHASGSVLAHQSSGRLASVALVDAAVSR